jgi:hypothetical protein
LNIIKSGAEISLIFKEGKLSVAPVKAPDIKDYKVKIGA